MTNDQTLKLLYAAVDQRQRGDTANEITQRLRNQFGIATGEGMVGTDELDESIRALNISSETRLADLGSGTAEPSRWIADQTGCGVVAVDVSSERVIRIPRSPSVHAICADLNGGLPFRSATFTACVQYDSIVHVRDRDAYLSELRRLVEPGSNLALTSSTTETLTDGERRGLGDVEGTIWRLTTSELEAVLERNGWTVTMIRSRRAAMLAYHAARRDAFHEAEQHLRSELPEGGFDRLVSRAATVASLLEQERLDMVFVTATCRT